MKDELCGKNNGRTCCIKTKDMMMKIKKQRTQKRQKVCNKTKPKNLKIIKAV